MVVQALAPDTHVRAHYGPTNKKLRCHLPILVPRGADGTSCAWIKVAGETRRLEEGRAVLFDDSFLHEAANTSSEEPRVVLIVDLWHPDLSDEEVFMRPLPCRSALHCAADWLCSFTGAVSGLSEQGAGFHRAEARQAAATATAGRTRLVHQ